MSSQKFWMYAAAVLLSASEVVRIDVSSELTNLDSTYPFPLAKLKAGGQEVSALVDTGAPFLFLVWRKWFEAAGQKCDDLIFGCYECVPPCEEGQTKAFCFADDTCVALFMHESTFNFGSELSTEVDIGLVADFSDAPEEIWASLGLGASCEESMPYLSIVEQLAAKKIITDRSFSIYFNEEKFASGGIILGGEDPSKQEGPLKFFKIVDNKKQHVQLHGLQVGNDPKYLISMSYPAVFDTGSTHIYINEKWKSQMISFLQEAGKKKFSIRQEGINLIISCSDADNVPAMTFIVEGLEGEPVFFEVSPRALVWSYKGDDCLLRIHFDDGDEILFGIPAFVGNYYYFDPDAQSIGYTKSKQ